MIVEGSGDYGDIVSAGVWCSRRLSGRFISHKNRPQTKRFLNHNDVYRLLNEKFNNATGLQHRYNTHVFIQIIMYFNKFIFYYVGISGKLGTWLIFLSTAVFVYIKFCKRIFNYSCRSSNHALRTWRQFFQIEENFHSTVFHSTSDSFVKNII